MAGPLALPLRARPPLGGREEQSTDYWCSEDVCQWRTLLLVVRPGAPSGFLLLVVMPFALSSVLLLV